MNIKQVFCKHDHSTAGVEYENGDKIQWCCTCKKILVFKVRYFELSTKPSTERTGDE